MKKLMLPIIIVVVLGVSSGITAVIVTRTNAKQQTEVFSAPPAEELTVTSGRYYLNGDKSQKIWLEVNPDFLTLAGDDADDHLMNCAKKQYENYDNADDAIKSLYEASKQIFFGEKYYSVEFLHDTLYSVEVSRYGDSTSSVYPIESGSKAAFLYYKDENRIQCAEGDFILVED